MFHYIYWRYLKYPKYFLNPKGIAAFGQRCFDSLVREILKVTKSVTEKRQELTARKEKLKHQEKKLRKSAIMEEDDFHNVKLRIRIAWAVIIVLVLAEIGLNYFTTLIIFGSDNAGLFWALIRWAVAITITAVAVVSTERFLEEALPKERYKIAETRKRNIVTMTFWGLLLIFCLSVIYFLGLVRAHDVEGGKAIAESGVANDVVIGMIILSMVLPVVIGGIFWDMEKYRGAYTNYKKCEKIQSELSKIEILSDLLAVRSNQTFLQVSAGWWDTFNVFKVYKENYNYKNQIEEDITKDDKYKFLKDFDSFKAPAHKAFKENMEETDRLLDLPSSDFEIEDSEIDQEVVPQSA